MTLGVNHMFCKTFQNRLIGQISNIMLTGRFINHINAGAIFAKFLADTLELLGFRQAAGTVAATGLKPFFDFFYDKYLKSYSDIGKPVV